MARIKLQEGGLPIVPLSVSALVRSIHNRFPLHTHHQHIFCPLFLSLPGPQVPCCHLLGILPLFFF